MKRNNKEPIPEHFESAEEAGDFWDVHDLADYWDQTRETDLSNCSDRHQGTKTQRIDMSFTPSQTLLLVVDPAFGEGGGQGGGGNLMCPSSKRVLKE